MHMLFNCIIYTFRTQATVAYFSYLYKNTLENRIMNSQGIKGKKKKGGQTMDHDIYKEMNVYIRVF